MYVDPVGYWNGGRGRITGERRTHRQGRQLDALLGRGRGRITGERRTLDGVDDLLGACDHAAEAASLVSDGHSCRTLTLMAKAIAAEAASLVSDGHDAKGAGRLQV